MTQLPGNYYNNNIVSCNVATILKENEWTMMLSQGKTPSYDLYLDDSGPRKPNKGDDPNRELNYFSFGGYLVESERANEINDLHGEFVSHWNIDYPLHSTKIRGDRGQCVVWS